MDGFAQCSVLEVQQSEGTGVLIRVAKTYYVFYTKDKVPEEEVDCLVKENVEKVSKLRLNPTPKKSSYPMAKEGSAGMIYEYTYERKVHAEEEQSDAGNATDATL